MYEWDCFPEVPLYQMTHREALDCSPAVANHILVIVEDTFLLVQWRQDAIVSADLEVDLLLHSFWDGALRDDDAHSGLDGAQDASVGVEDASRRRHHRVAFVFILVVVQGAWAGRERVRRSFSRFTASS